MASLDITTPPPLFRSVRSAVLLQLDSLTLSPCRGWNSNSLGWKRSNDCCCMKLVVCWALEHCGPDKVMNFNNIQGPYTRNEIILVWAGLPETQVNFSTTMKTLLWGYRQSCDGWFSLYSCIRTLMTCRKHTLHHLHVFTPVTISYDLYLRPWKQQFVTWTFVMTIKNGAYLQHINPIKRRESNLP
jgi:hypothetical protein